MLKVNIFKAQAVNPQEKESVSKSVSIVIDKEWKGPDPTGMTQDRFFKAQDKLFNDQAMIIAEALQNTLPRGTWDRLVGIMVRRHATYLVVNQKTYEDNKGGI